nr:uncharacterized protein LOC115269145 [Aedes albopictus]
MGPASSTVNRYDRGQDRSLPLEPTPARRYSKENSQAPLLPLWGNHQSMHFNHHPGGGPYKTKPSKMTTTTLKQMHQPMQPDRREDQSPTNNDETKKQTHKMKRRSCTRRIPSHAYSATAVQHGVTT